MSRLRDVLIAIAFPLIAVAAFMFACIWLWLPVVAWEVTLWLGWGRDVAGVVSIISLFVAFSIQLGTMVALGGEEDYNL